MVILSAKELFVVINCEWDMDLVTGGTEVCRRVKVFEKRLLVQGRLCLHELIINPLQGWVFTESERVLFGFFDREVGVSASTVDVSDRMADSTSDPRLRGRVIDVVKFRIVESSTEKRDGIVTTGTEP